MSPLPKLIKLADNPTVRARFAQALAESDAPTPLSVYANTGGYIGIVASNNELIAEMSPDLSTEIAKRIANLLCQAVNTLAATSAPEPLPKSGVLASLHDGDRAP